MVGIEAMNAYGGSVCMDVETIFGVRKLDSDRFANLMMKKKAVNLPCEDTVTNAVNAAKPIIDALSDAERESITMLITSTESGLDFGKAVSTYIHSYLNLSPNCRVIELKQACYAGTAALHLAACYVQSNACPGAKVLVVCSDTARAAARNTYYEPSQGTGAVAMLVSDKPHILELDWGAFGYHSFEVMDTCRPTPEIEAGNSDLSLLSYLECLEKSFGVYQSKVDAVDFCDTFDFLAFHTPFAGMVKGAHRKMMRKLQRFDGEAIERDFERRMMPSIRYCADIGNIYSATIYLALASLIDNASFQGSARVGFFSYGSGCSAEFYSGVVTDESKRRLERMRIGEHNAARLDLPVDLYDRILDLNREWLFGVENREVSLNGIESIYERQFAGQGKLVLTRVKDYHREYKWS